MKNKKSMLILAGIIATIGICLLLLSMFFPNNNNKKQKKEKPIDYNVEVTESIKELDKNQKEVQEVVKLFNSYLLDTNKTTIDYEKLTGIQENYFVPMVGADSISLHHIPEEYAASVKEDLSAYDKKQRKYANNLAKAIKENFSLILQQEPLYTDNNKQLMQIVSVKPFSYTLYEMDVKELQSALLDLAGIKESESIEVLPQMYKSLVKAMEILDSQLSNYKNEKEFETNLIFDIGKTITCNNCHLYINYAEGAYLDSVMPQENYDDTKEQRIDEIINKAIDEGILDKKNPLKLI